MGIHQMNKVSHIVRPKTLETPTMLTQRFDGSGRGELSDREAFNVLKMQHKVNISQEKVNLQHTILSIVIWNEQL